MSLTVEDGTGKTDADSYLSVADADTYHTNHGDSTSWSGSSTAQKEEALRMATQYLDIVYGPVFDGWKATRDQALEWPRSGIYDSSGYYVYSNTLPQKLEDATAELALRHRTETNGLLPDVTTDRSISASRVRVGEIEEEIEYSGTQPTFNRFTKVEALLRDFICGSNYIPRA